MEGASLKTYESRGEAKAPPSPAVVPRLLPEAFPSILRASTQLWLHSTDVTQHNLGISNGQEISIRTVSQDEVPMERPLQYFEVYKMNLENSLLWKMKT